MPTSPPRKSILILIFNTLPRCTMRRIHAPNGEIMRFYRPLGRISALTFDTDDTLYDNRPVILRTEREALTFVQNYHPALRSFQNEDLQRLRRAVREAEPEIYHDVTRWRFRSIEQAMLDAGLSAEEASAGAHAAMINFAKWRSRIDVPQQTHDTLKQLAKKWPLVAITNGNAQPELFGLGIILSLCCALVRTGAQNRSAICTFWRRKNSTCRSARSYMLGTISPLTWVGQFAAECRLVGSDRKMAI